MKKISWDKQATAQFRDALNFIRKDSFQNADKVKHQVFEKIDELLQFPEKCSLDKYKINNNGNYRAFELHRHRISYLIKKEEIIIICIRHSSMKPEEY